MLWSWLVKFFLQNFEFLSHRGLCIKMLKTLVFWVSILTLLTAFKKKVYFNYRLQKHRCEILGFSTKNPRGENTFAPKCSNSFSLDQWSHICWYFVICFWCHSLIILFSHTNLLSSSSLLSVLLTVPKNEKVRISKIPLNLGFRLVP